jgi:UDP-N-acetylglucosamine acyltransferase
MPNIHPSAIVDPKAQLDDSVEIGAYTLVGPHVQIGAGTVIGPHCVVEGHATIGRNNRVFQFCSLGAVPQDMKYKGEPTRLEIGDENVIREFATFNLGTTQDDGVTRLGSHNWIMAYVHLAHDCKVGNHTIFANKTQLAGHVHVGNWVVLGGDTGVHQFVRIGDHANTGIATVLRQDVPPFVMVSGDPAKPYGLNSVGLKRRGFSAEHLAAVKQAYDTVYRAGNTLEEAKRKLAEQAGQGGEAQASLQLLLDFLSTATRGIVR